MRVVLKMLIFFIPVVFISCQPKDNKPITFVEPPDQPNKISISSFDSINWFIARLNSTQYLQGPATGFDGSPNVDYGYYTRLLNIADDSILLKLTYHENPNMRVYGLKGLSLKNPKLAELQLDRFYSDSSIVTEQNGCIITTLPIYYFATVEFDSAVLARHELQSFLNKN